MKYCSALLLSAAAFVALTLPGPVRGETSSTSEKKTKPYSIGLVPFLDYNADKGFGYGIVFMFDDKRSPEYQPYYLSHLLSLQRSTRGIAEYKYRLDSKYFLPADLRLTFEAMYQASLFEPYHGPGGAQTLFSQAFIDTASAQYRGKYYYMFDKRYLLVNTIIQGKLKGEYLRWLVGLIILSTNVDTLNYDDHEPTDPGRQTLLARHWDLQGQDMGGGNENGVMLGLVWDQRDHEISPHKGFWSEILLRWVPNMLGNDFDYAALSATHRHYFHLSDPLTLAFRLSGRLMSDGAPFFSLSRLDGSFVTETAVGGKKTVRGILWQRALGKRFLYGNLELRYRILSLFQTGYLAGCAFYDFGRTFDEPPPDTMTDRGDDQDRWHRGLGIGGRAAPHSTFIVALDLALPVDKRMDGPGLKLYIGLDWLF
ncbi:MAG: BamA/TamA family outer membrane protein [Fidelibacterota bacterium]|nr:MAG: BamA/TamA family outer membrane protein [Candidatus Neomarinimicrobiota bacterium]